MEEPTKWLPLLPWAEYSYNTYVHTSLGTSSFHVVYGRLSPQIIPYDSQTYSIEAINEILQERDKILTFLKMNLQQTQHRMK